MPESVFQNLALDESKGVGAARSADDTPIDAVLYRSDFDAGFDGFTDHWDGFRPWPIVSLTEMCQHSGARSLMLSTGEEASPVSGDPANAPAVFRRMDRHDQYRYHSFSAWVALGSGGYDGAFGSFTLMFDTQKWDAVVGDDTDRSFFQLNCGARPGPNPDWWRWKILNNAGAQVTVTAADNSRFIGLNENKQGMAYVRFTVDLAANSGDGGYHSMQVGPYRYDLSALSGGHSSEPPQLTTLGIDNFNGSLNIGFSLSRNQANAGGCQLFIDDVAYTASNTAPGV